MASHPDVAWYLSKAEECERQAMQGTNAEARARYENEARLWREIAADIAKNRPS